MKNKQLQVLICFVKFAINQLLLPLQFNNAMNLQSNGYLKIYYTYRAYPNYRPLVRFSHYICIYYSICSEIDLILAEGKNTHHHCRRRRRRRHTTLTNQYSNVLFMRVFVEVLFL